MSRLVDLRWPFAKSGRDGDPVAPEEPAKTTSHRGGNPDDDSQRHFRTAGGKDCLRPLRLEKHSYARVVDRHAAGASGLTCAVRRGCVGQGPPNVAPFMEPINRPFTGEKPTAVPVRDPDVTVVCVRQPGGQATSSPPDAQPAASGSSRSTREATGRSSTSMRGRLPASGFRHQVNAGTPDREGSGG